MSHFFLCRLRGLYFCPGHLYHDHLNHLFLVLYLFHDCHLIY
jgi:hypothetical protein